MGPISHFCSQANCPCSRRSSLPAVQRNPHGLQQLWQALLANSGYGSVVILSHWSYQWTQKFGHLEHPTIQELSNLWVQTWSNHFGPGCAATDQCFSSTWADRLVDHFGTKTIHKIIGQPTRTMDVAELSVSAFPAFPAILWK